ncbi:hypothetical protein ACWGMA_40610 [Streptomyces asiaticus]
MGDSDGDDDEQRSVRNDLSGEVHGPVGQFGTVHGDVHMHWSGPPANPDEAEFRSRFIKRKQAEWDEEDRKQKEKRSIEQGKAPAQAESKAPQSSSKDAEVRRIAGWGSLAFAVIAYFLFLYNGDLDGWGSAFGFFAGAFSVLFLLMCIGVVD